MASNFCLVPELAEKFKQAVVDGTIDIEKLSKSTSDERHAFFNELLGERNAKEVNSLFESKLLLKNQKRGLVNWAQQVAGMKPEVKRELADKIEKMTALLSPEDEKMFYKELASKRLGTDITTNEAKQIVELSNKIKSLENHTNKSERINYGRAKLELAEYVNSLNPKKANLVTNIAGVPRSLMASLDLSAPLNQGWGMLSRKQFYSAFKDMFRYAKSESGLLDLQADILTRPNYKAAKKAGLRLTDLGDNLLNREEQFMSTLLDKVPGIKGSQRAYTGFLNKLRMDVFDDLVAKAKLAGEDVGQGSKVFEDLARVVNNFTGGARAGKFEAATPALNAVFFSPRKITSTLQILNPVNYINPKISKTARKAALRNLIGSIGITVGVYNLIKLTLPDATLETDPRSSDFGKLKIGDTRIDLSGGNANYITLIARLLDPDRNNKDRTLTQSLRYKLSPNASLLIDSIVGSNAIGEKKTVTQSVIDRFKPMFLNSMYELYKSDTEAKPVITVLGLLGSGVNTYEEKSKNPPLKSLKKLPSKKLKPLKK